MFGGKPLFYKFVIDLIFRCDFRQIFFKLRFLFHFLIFLNILKFILIFIITVKSMIFIYINFHILL